MAASGRSSNGSTRRRIVPCLAWEMDAKTGQVVSVEIEKPKAPAEEAAEKN